MGHLKTVLDVCCCFFIALCTNDVNPSPFPLNSTTHIDIGRAEKMYTIACLVIIS